MKSIVMLLVILNAAPAFADKAATNIEFNQLIDDTNNERKELRALPKPELDAREQAKVIDFIDVEIGVGKSPSVATTNEQSDKN